MFNKVLIANRGEIAVRIARACREMGVGSVAVYSEVDREALHVRIADEAVPVGGALPAESYLAIDRIIAAAREVGAEAIHPGYGFLAENPAFASACEAAGRTFIGPTAATLELCGSKTAARRLAVTAGVPIVPGVDRDLTDAEVSREAARLGYPVVVKATAGGGGRGMRVVERSEELPRALQAVRSEAGSAFGESALYIERYLQHPRHVEIQVLADGRGRVLHLGERECSIQRRHQKILEESPSPAVTPTLRRRMGEAAVALAAAAGYRNVGTVEFLVDADGVFYFLEINPRLQVEHPVTEMVTGIDLVRAQITIAAGERLSLRQRDILPRGHAMECRISAEDPDHDFCPVPGRITLLASPGGPGIREDSGVYAGWEVPIHYDPLMGKVIAWGRDRAEAISRMTRALAEYRIGGIETTVPFLLRLLRDPAFRRGEVDTGFVDRLVHERGLPVGRHHEVAVIAAALLIEKEESGRPGRPLAPNRGGSGWRTAARLEGLRDR